MFEGRQFKQVNAPIAIRRQRQFSQLKPRLKHESLNAKHNLSLHKQRCNEKSSNVSQRQHLNHQANDNLTYHSPDKAKQSLNSTVNTAKQSGNKFKLLYNNAQHKLKIKHKIQLWQNDISGLMRVVIIDWLGEVCEELGISKQVKYTAVANMDRLVVKTQVKKKDYQLMGLCCLMVAQKLDSRKTLTVETAIELMDGSISEELLNQAQQKIILILNFKLRPFTPWNQMSILLAGLQAYLGNQLWEDNQKKTSIKRRIFWLIQAIVLQQNINSSNNNQKIICLAILYSAEFSKKVKQQFQEWARKMLDMPQFDAMSLKPAIQMIAIWSKFECTCIHNIEEYKLIQRHHKQLKQIITENMILI